MREWEGPLYEVDGGGGRLGWRMHCEVHRAVEFEGELRVDDPDGIVVEAAFVPAADVRGAPRRRASTGCASRWRSGWPSGGSRRRAAASTTTCAAPARRPRLVRLDPLVAVELRRPGPAVGTACGSCRDRRPSILHLDLDAFYASVEQLADPSLRGPAGRRRRAREPRRRRGRELRGAAVRRSIPRCRWRAPGGRARTRCSSRPGSTRTRDASTQVMAILRDVTPLVEPISLDEAFLDVSGARRLARDRPGDRRGCCARRIRAETGLTASVGVATTKMLAKLASDLAKPDGLLVVEPGTELEFLAPARRSAGSGASGPATRRRLDGLGVETVGDLAELPSRTLTATLGQRARHPPARAGVEPRRPRRSSPTGS